MNKNDELENDSKDKNYGEDKLIGLVRGHNNNNPRILITQMVNRKSVGLRQDIQGITNISTVLNVGQYNSNY